MTGTFRPDRNLVAPVHVELPVDHPDVAVAAKLAELGSPDAVALRQLASQYPASSLIWARLAESVLPTDPVAAYAFSRTGYHRGLDALRRAGWRGQGLILPRHEVNQGFLRALLALAEAAEAIGESEEAERCQQFLRDSGTSAEEISALRAL